MNTANRTVFANEVHKFFLYFCFALLLQVIFVSAGFAQDIGDRKRKTQHKIFNIRARYFSGARLSLNEPVSRKNIPIHVHLKNISPIKKKLRKPPKTEKQKQWFDYFDVQFDGQAAEPYISLPNADRAGVRKGFKKVEPGSSYEFTMDVSKQYVIPDQWNTLSVEMIRAFASGRIYIEKTTDGKYVALEQNPVLPSNREEYDDHRIDITMNTEKFDFDQERFILVVNVKNPSKHLTIIQQLFDAFDKKEWEFMMGGDTPEDIVEPYVGPVTLPLSKATILDNISISADGTELKRKKKNKDQKRKRTVKPDKEHKVTLDLNRWFSLPEEWKQMKIAVNRFHPSIYLTEETKITKNKFAKNHKK